MPNTLPRVSPLMVRRFTPTGEVYGLGGIIALRDFTVEDVGHADGRLPYDADVVDCSRRIFQLTSLMLFGTFPSELWVFPSRRWRNFRTDQYIDRYPDEDHPLLYIGNPVYIGRGDSGLLVERSPEFLIKSGMELGF